MFGVPLVLIGPDRFSAEIVGTDAGEVWIAAVVMASGAGLGADAVDDVDWCQRRSCRRKCVLDACAQYGVTVATQKRRAYIRQLRDQFVAFKSVCVVCACDRQRKSDRIDVSHSFCWSGGAE